MAVSDAGRGFREPAAGKPLFTVETTEPDLDFACRRSDHFGKATTGVPIPGRERIVMNKWILAAILASVAMIMYIRIIYNMS